MVKTIRTGASATLRYGYEKGGYGTIGSGTVSKKFGLQDSVSNFSLTHNRIDLAQLNQVEYAAYAYGQQAASLSVGFTLSNPWIFESIFGTPTVSTSEFTFGGLTSGNTPTTPTTIQAVIAVGGSEVDDLHPSVVADIKKVRGQEEVILVHGGGKEVTKVTEQLGKEPKFVVSPGGVKS